MGLTQKLGTIPLAILTDSSNNVGIGGAANASFKLQVTGATNLTGALSGTSGTFSGSVGVNSTIRSTGQTDPSSGVGMELFYRAADTSSYIQSYDRTNGAWKDVKIYGNTLYFGSQGTNNLTIASTGAATFSNSVTAQTGEFNSGGQEGSLGSVVRISTTNTNGNARNWGIVNTWDNYGDLTFRISNEQGGNALSAGSNVLTLLRTGAAIFSSSATFGSDVFTYANGGIFFNGGGSYGSGIFQQSGGTLALQTGTTPRLQITSGGNVGIGTDIPASNMQLGRVFGFIQDINSGYITANRGTNENYIVSQYAVRIHLDSALGHINFDTAPSGTAGTYAPLSNIMKVTANGLAINNPSDKSESLSVQGPLGNWTAFFQASTTGSNSLGPLVYAGTNTNDWCMYSASASGTPYFRVRGDGATFVAGSLSKGSGSFRIDHPLESMSETHELVHSFIEGPQADLIYRGKLTLVNGKAQANIDELSTMTNGTFEALCREVQCFTTNESGWDLVKGKVIGNIIYIESQNVNSTDEISWMVIGERKDKHMIDTGWTDENGKVIVEPLKIDEPENLPNNNKQ
jgi:hypothetical protein